MDGQPELLSVRRPRHAGGGRPATDARGARARREQDRVLPLPALWHGHTVPEVRSGNSALNWPNSMAPQDSSPSGQLMLMLLILWLLSGPGPGFPLDLFIAASLHLLLKDLLIAFFDSARPYLYPYPC